MMQRVARATSLATRHARAAQRQCAPLAQPPLQSIARRADHGSSSSGSVRFKVTVPRASADTRKRLKPKLTKDKFAALTTAFFERVALAVAPLQPPMNDDFALETAIDGVLTIRTDAKAFELKVVAAKQQLEFTSPISGVRVYAWNQRTQRWEDESDAHDLEGLLTRDLMRLCSGVPAF